MKKLWWLLAIPIGFMVFEWVCVARNNYRINKEIEQMRRIQYL